MMQKDFPLINQENLLVLVSRILESRSVFIILNNENKSFLITDTINYKINYNNIKGLIII
jgi:hypothetical protein